MRVHLINAGKYFSVILIQFANIFKHKIKGDLTLNIFVAISLISTLYAFAWDLYMDWGLLRSKEAGKFGLRSKILLPSWFYYYSIVTNFFLRFTWVLPLFASQMPAWVLNTQVLIGILCLAEGYRRAQWAIIRLENEQINNFEKYRTFLEIPAIKEEDE
jgi:xenotropic and polytropic retrovirus receptor 1